MEQFMQNAPEGNLRISSLRGKPRYYCRESKKDREGLFIHADNLKLAEQLAQKAYSIRVSKSAKAELQSIEKYLRLFPDLTVEKIYETMSDARKALVRPLWEPDDVFVRNWLSVKYNGKEFSADTPVLYTDQGERVRSKSEVIIANLLSKYKIPYRYEFPIVLQPLGTVYPDFTALQVRSREEKIWEHFGRMDFPEYAEKTVRKIITYEMNGYRLGENLIVTFETKNNPISIQQVRRIITEKLL